ncbi:hypothetical protein Hanom_Chr01g00068971 [Helianthus anomalus]
MIIKVKPQGSRCKRFQIWTKVAKVTKPQGSKWQFTLLLLTQNFYLYNLFWLWGFFQNKIDFLLFTPKSIS